MILNRAFAPCGARAITATATFRTHGVFSPLTPALSPLRGEGDAVMHRLIRETRSLRFGSMRWLWHKTMSASMDTSCAKGVSRFPSPLSGERAGVRGENLHSRAKCRRSVRHCAGGVVSPGSVMRASSISLRSQPEKASFLRLCRSVFMYSGRASRTWASVTGTRFSR